MNPADSKRPEDNFPPDPLEECLHSARWPQPTGLQRGRLEAKWELLAAKRSRFRRNVARCCLAAGVLLAVGAGIGWWAIGQWGVNQPEERIAPREVPVPQTPLVQHPTIERRDPAKPTPWVRSATRGETLVFGILQRRQDLPEEQRQHPLGEVLSLLIEHPDVGAAFLCEPLKPQRLEWEALLLDHFGSLSSEQQQAALTVLAQIGSARAIPRLKELHRDPHSKLAARVWPVMLKLAPPRVLGEWAIQGTLPQRQDLLKTLLARRDKGESLNVVLHLVATPASRTLALSVLEQQPNPPIPELFQRLKTGNKEQRFTAGLVLGRIANREMSAQLLALAEQHDFPPEVMVALMNVPDREVAQLLNRAQHNPQVRTAVQLARLEWKLVSYESTLPFIPWPSVLEIR